MAKSNSNRARAWRNPVVAMPSLFGVTCGARLRRRPGRCHRLVKNAGDRCPVHSGGDLSDEGRAVIAASARARHAKQAQAIARGEARRFPQGRKRKHLIPRHWRFALSESDEAAAIARVARHDARTGVVRPPWSPVPSRTGVAVDLERFERAFVVALNDCDRPLSEARMEQFYATARDAERILGLPGAAVRLERLAWERERWFFVRATDAAVRQVAGERTRSPPVAPPPVLPATRPTGLSPLRNQITPKNNQTTAAPSVDPMQRAREFSELIVRAGRHAGAVHRGERTVSDIAFTKAPAQRF